jgi:hypothetical protein
MHTHVHHMLCYIILCSAIDMYVYTHAHMMFV